MANQLNITTPIEDIVELESQFLSTKSLEERKSKGQFFTGERVAQYMASLIEPPVGQHISILDAGAGTGILTAMTALKLIDTPVVSAVLYELDEGVIPYLKQTLKVVEKTFEQAGHRFEYEIRNVDFVLNPPTESFDLSVINPPYFKYNVKTSPYAGATKHLYKGDPNIYASFMAIVMDLLKDGGQLVSITPRSFTNGLYFKGFRHYLLDQSALNTIHIFKHRNRVFKNSDSSVLQENIICKFTRGMKQEAVTIRSSGCDASISNAYECSYPETFIIESSDERIIRIPDSKKEAQILMQAELLPTTFTGAGYFISTGRAVEHRTRTYISTDHDSDNTVPLYRPHNITPMVCMWTGEHVKDVSFALIDEYQKHINENRVYTLLKRFSSKDEARRLVAGVHLPGAYPCIAFGNKTNYIGRKDGELSKVEAFGLAAIFNSTFMDTYFRCISGNTQVNATEVRVMKFPSREQVLEIGEKAYHLTSTEQIDSIVNNVIGIKDNEPRGKAGAGKNVTCSAGNAPCTV